MRKNGKQNGFLTITDRNNMKVSVILGTRPEIIKMSPIIRELKLAKFNFFILHTNQHYSGNMDQLFFEELKLPPPKYNLNIKEKTHGKMTGEMMIKIEDILNQEKPDLILIEGDTNTILASSIVASKMNIKIGHVEAGLRSYDHTMPEEINRIVADNLSDFLFAPTINQEKILLKEGIDKNKIFVTGNTIVDAVQQNLAIAESIKKYVHYQKEKYFLLTLHRASNVDQKNILSRLISTLEKVSTKFNTSIYFPIHPRTKHNIDKFKIEINKNYFRIIQPVGYLEMLMMEKYAKVILTDSGGIQEEACILHVPCVTLRNNTERPETTEAKSNVLVGNREDNVIKGVKKMINSDRVWKNPFGYGNSAKIIIDILIRSYV